MSLKSLFARFRTPAGLLVLLLLCALPTLWSCSKADVVDVNAVDDATIQDYLKRHNYTAADYQRTASGLYLVTLTAGMSTGAAVTLGKEVVVKYTGKFISAANENQVFDTSDNALTKQFKFIVGARTPDGKNELLIPGWTEGVLLMRQGDRKLLLIPSYLAYGPSGSGPIPGNTPILFDMQILSVSP